MIAPIVTVIAAVIESRILRLLRLRSQLQRRIRWDQARVAEIEKRIAQLDATLRHTGNDTPPPGSPSAVVMPQPIRTAVTSSRAGNPPPP